MPSPSLEISESEAAYLIVRIFSKFGTADEKKMLRSIESIRKLMDNYTSPESFESIAQKVFGYDTKKYDKFREFIKMRNNKPFTPEEINNPNIYTSLEKVPSKFSSVLYRFTTQFRKCETITLATSRKIDILESTQNVVHELYPWAMREGLIHLELKNAGYYVQPLLEATNLVGKKWFLFRNDHENSFQSELQDNKLVRGVSRLNILFLANNRVELVIPLDASDYKKGEKHFEGSYSYDIHFEGLLKVVLTCKSFNNTEIIELAIYFHSLSYEDFLLGTFVHFTNHERICGPIYISFRPLQRDRLSVSAESYKNFLFLSQDQAVKDLPSHLIQYLFANPNVTIPVGINTIDEMQLWLDKVKK